MSELLLFLELKKGIERISAVRAVRVQSSLLHTYQNRADDLLL